MMEDRISCKRHRDAASDQQHAVSGRECDCRLLCPLGTAPLEKTSTFCILYVISPAFALLSGHEDMRISRVMHSV